MAEITSKGLNALSHYSNSRLSMSMDEPIYLNLWTVEIQLPDSIGADSESTNLLLEGIQKVDGLDTNKVPAAGTAQKYKSSDRRFADAGPENTYIDVKMDFEINLQRTSNGPTMQQLKILKKWCDMVYDPLTGRMGLKIDYVAPQVNITLHDKAYNPFWSWTLYDVWPTTNLTVPALSYVEKNAIYKITDFTIACDRWTETML